MDIFSIGYKIGNAFPKIHSLAHYTFSIGKATSKYYCLYLHGRKKAQPAETCFNPRSCVVDILEHKLCNKLMTTMFYDFI